MGVFSNGMQGMDYKEQYCKRCVNWRDKDDDRGFGCTVWDLHLLYNGEDDKRVVLDKLIPMTDGFRNEECTMFLETMQ